MPLIMAIDPNTKTGIAEGEPGGTPRLTSCNFRQDETDTPADIAKRATFFFADRLRTNPPDIVFIEAPVPPSTVSGATNFSTSRITLGMNFLLLGIFGCKGIPVREAPINSWRKYAFSTGHMKGAVAKKQAMELCKCLGWNAPTHDSAEAACIWLYGCSLVAPQSVIRHEPLFTRVA